MLPHSSHTQLGKNPLGEAALVLHIEGAACGQAGSQDDNTPLASGVGAACLQPAGQSLEQACGCLTPCDLQQWGMAVTRIQTCSGGTHSSNTARPAGHASSTTWTTAWSTQRSSQRLRLSRRRSEACMRRPLLQAMVVFAEQAAGIQQEACNARPLAARGTAPDLRQSPLQGPQWLRSITRGVAPKAWL